MRYRLLAAEDEPQLRMMLWDYFTAKDFDVTTCRDGEEALAKLEEQAFDIVFLDIMMPKLDGLTVCRALRRENPVPVIFLTARSGEENELLGYGFGGDDYVTKPFSLPVLHAKALALIKRAKGRGLTARMLEMGGIQVDDLRREVSVDETPISLTPKEYELLVCLMEHRGMVLSREQLLRRVWGYAYDGDIRTVDTHIKKLRKALGRRAGEIRTVIKTGYRFEPEEPEGEASSAVLRRRDAYGPAVLARNAQVGAGAAAAVFYVRHDAGGRQSGKQRVWNRPAVNQRIDS